MQKNKQNGGQLHAIAAIFALIVSTTLCFIPILFVGLLKLFPNKNWQSLCTRCVDKIATFWCGINNFYVAKAQKIHWEISGLNNLTPKDWYLVVANHQSWLDIVILQRLFNRKIPVLKFFIKDQLKWIPLLGFSWWAMGCPFMKRYSKEYLAKNPHKQGKDIISTRKAIETFKRTPASIMNFVEGTRFTKVKKEQQQSPYNYLLKPKAGGISFIINSMGQQIKSLIDVTIVYAEKNHSLWDFLCKRVKKVKIIIRQLPIPAQFTSANLINDFQAQNAFKEWLNEQWAIKDNLIASLQE
ncbi:acyltransferase [Legionella pneumophila]|jgi:1-acyl-sn-glycerol-3-phosphate acyltransferase|uniref:Acyltransferase n=1 Tax=Legionella pneumophila TaxID=446 RepID=A0AAN5KP49_LEGPN|nr:acyltransferase [Legionella pneumophila]MCZ4724897.1 acyltransferase [Legionella pneumophila]RYW93490.1 acyltransferase [Legionella pneumophila]CZI47429.1 Probable acyltransferase yihG [Legionella pneumophila]CZI72205.1 Probable acyltransferase yihG [Legionella pneumophila]CZI78838.1 Probable acyltransferase yihG [Legionella pneumophila]